MALEYIFFCDESDRRGKFYSNFYGGVRVSSAVLEQTSGKLQAKAKELGLNGEIKWQKVDASNTERYGKMMDDFFTEIANGRLFVRIMFTKNVFIPVGLSREQQTEEYFILYYQFLKHAFGLAQMPDHGYAPRVRIYLDEMGDTKEKIAKFRGYVAGLGRINTRSAHGFLVSEQDITEVRSHDHILMQCLDVVLGAICFRLNDKHKEIPEGQSRRGKRTVAKEQLYNHINKLICSATGKLNFNIGISTGRWGKPGDYSWSGPYLHWLFRPRETQYDISRAKRQNADAPLRPT
jgi:hypothetical protein